MSSTLLPNESLSFTITIKEDSVIDVNQRCLYLSANPVSLLPVRRVIASSGFLRETIILLGLLQPKPSSALLRIKHVAIDFSRDFVRQTNFVPGLRIIGQIRINTEHTSGFTELARGQRVFVFPYSNCLLQNCANTCENCRLVSLQEDDVAFDKADQYDLHRNYPCTEEWIYGRTIDGGLQDFIQIPHPSKLLLLVPDQVSLRDCCFLLDVAVPFMSYCKDHLCQGANLMGRTLVILNDVKKESNDCLLVIRHLLLNDQQFTFTDVATLRESPSLQDTYQKRFNDVFIIAAGQQALDFAVSFRAPNMNFNETNEPQITLLSTQSHDLTIPHFINVAQLSLSFKDRFLMEELLLSIAEMNLLTKSQLPKRFTWSLGSSLDSYRAEVQPSSFFDEDSSFFENLLLFSGRIDTESSIINLSLASDSNNLDKGRSRKLLRWFQCDYCLNLGPDDQCDHALECTCLLTKTINRLLAEQTHIRRVFLTITQRSNRSVNALIFS
ncbi:hypothetical protein PUMCH_000213 [Australozyma saopauloensis]|uniref:Uncharacterized protein n=1 Tax=Australozyma saopauloensis TaxID=291208 RepID=A0AAX4H346_9ASCO|nr:hypothetical protein PUMCH_000213 [[Candida] saopauloensis]